jgi:hypothetical protein
MKPECECSTGNETTRQKNIWYVYRNSEEYDRTSKHDAGMELEDHSLRGFNPPGIEKESQLAGSHHLGPATDITQALELFNQGVDKAEANHEGESDNSANSFIVQGVDAGLREIQSEPLSSMQQEKEWNRLC